MNEELVIRISSHFGLENDTRRLDIVQNVYKFWAQNVLIPCILVTSQNVLTFLFLIYVYIYIYILHILKTKKYTWKLDIVQNLCEFWRFFLSDFLSPKCPNTTRPKCVPGDKMS